MQRFNSFSLCRKALVAPPSTVATVRRFRGGAATAVAGPHVAAQNAAFSILPLFSAAALSVLTWLVLAINIRIAMMAVQPRQESQQQQPKQRMRTATTTFTMPQPEHKQRGRSANEARISAALPIAQQLRIHRHEKQKSLQGSLPPLVLILLAACLQVQSYPWQTVPWQLGPSATAWGLNVAYWTAEIVLDTVLDECGALALHAVAVFSFVQQLALIVMLTTRPHGHPVLWLKAADVLLATALAKVIDHPYWAGIAVLVIILAVFLVATDRLAPLPPGVPAVGVVAYFGATLLASTVYQLVQSSSGNMSSGAWVMGHVKAFRAGLLIATMCFFGTPPSWILYDAINFVIFFGLKVVTDTVAIQAVVTMTEESKKGKIEDNR